MCAYAARRALVVDPREARNAVIVVPIFNPKIRAAAVLKSTIPELAKAMVIPRVAEEDWTMAESQYKSFCI